MKCKNCKHLNKSLYYDNITPEYNYWCDVENILNYEECEKYKEIRES